MQTLNEALDILKQHLPPPSFLSFTTSLDYENVDSVSSGGSTSGSGKLTKVDTLRLASAYIQHLSDVLRRDDESRFATMSSNCNINNNASVISASCDTPPNASSSSSNTSSPSFAISTTATYHMCNATQHLSQNEMKTEPRLYTNVFVEKQHASGEASIVASQHSSLDHRLFHANESYYSHLAASSFDPNYKQPTSFQDFAHYQANKSPYGDLLSQQYNYAYSYNYHELVECGTICSMPNCSCNAGITNYNNNNLVCINYNKS